MRIGSFLDSEITLRDPRVPQGRLGGYFHRKVECVVHLKVEDFRSVVIYSPRRPQPVAAESAEKEIVQDDRD